MTIEIILVFLVALIIGLIAGAIIMALVIRNNQIQAAALNTAATAKAQAIITAVQQGVTDVEKIKGML
jgi:uncharacterized membrane-anchored protein YhcB (DUF1043 family)